jgi:hypothetical protein
MTERSPEKIYIPFTTELQNGLLAMLKPVQQLLLGYHRALALLFGGKTSHPSSPMSLWLDKSFSPSPRWVGKAKSIQKTVHCLQSFAFQEDIYLALLRSGSSDTGLRFELDGDSPYITMERSEIVPCLEMFFLGWHILVAPKAIVCMANMAEEERVMGLYEKLRSSGLSARLDSPYDRNSFRLLMEQRGVGAAWDKVRADVLHLERVRSAYLANPLRHLNHGGLL